MKAIFKSIFVCLTLVLGLSACNGKNEEMPATGGLDNAEKLIAGTYVGTWTKTNVTAGGEESSTGSITFAVDEELGNNVSVVTVNATESGFLSLDTNTSGCNVTRLSSGVLSYWNVYSLNPFGTEFTGKVSPEGVATMSFTKIVVVKRKETEFLYSFTGTKQ